MGAGRHRPPSRVAEESAISRFGVHGQRGGDTPVRRSPRSIHGCRVRAKLAASWSSR